MITRSVKNTVRPKSDTGAQTPVISIGGVVSDHQYALYTSVALQLTEIALQLEVEMQFLPLLRSVCEFYPKRYLAGFGRRIINFHNIYSRIKPRHSPLHLIPTASLVFEKVLS